MTTNKSALSMIEKYPIPWSDQKIIDFRRKLLEWYDQHQRMLPWRLTDDPYKIWVSEIMLQQTKVETVKPYYERFISTLPDVETLAQASEEELMTLWQGLGYYSRVRNMQTAAQQILELFNGVFPQDKEGLMTLKGIGPYTSGAIASIAFGKAEPAIDGNLTRIVTRLFDIEEDIHLSKTKKKIEAYVYQLIDRDRPGDFNQALMDMGATIMTASNPYPHEHPLQEFDLSYQNGTSQERPVKKKKIKASHHQMLAYVISNRQGQYLMRKHQETELLTGLWHYPIVEVDLVMEGATTLEIIEPLIQHYGNLLSQKDWESVTIKTSIHEGEHQEEIKHIFSHRVWHIKKVCVEVEVTDIEDSTDVKWVSLENLEELPVSTLQKKLMV